MRPETCVPTWTVTSADSVPVAVTLATIGPRSTVTVSKRGWALAATWRFQAQNPTMPPTSTAATNRTANGFFMGASALVRLRLSTGPGPGRRSYAFLPSPRGPWYGPAR